MTIMLVIHSTANVDDIGRPNVLLTKDQPFFDGTANSSVDLSTDFNRLIQRVTLPYWDWTEDNKIDSSIWDNDFMGGNGNLMIIRR